ncbi:hypothetical protein H5410_041844 [Solanum commersonii]|uniref:Histone deacetylase domain-containing protein n=1 Tax=Solanum commersonii TaxID=4109 RepID=A0A9J5XUB9_SOLCO|nr:hypothetical protein H5410_041844 [Solanum commersonii]
MEKGREDWNHGFDIFLCFNLKRNISSPTDFSPFCVNFISTISQPWAPMKGGENLRIEILALTDEGHGFDKMARASRLYLAFPAGQVHSESYLKSLNPSLNVSMIVEVPPVAMLPNCLVQKKVLHPFRKQVGGTILAAKLAKERGWAINVGGGFHHCSSEKGGGFCVYADISLCIHFAFVRLNISRVMIIDLDAHQGNGHEMDFSDDRRVFILDMYNPGIYPLDFEARRYIDLGVEVKSGTATDEYLTKLDHALEVAEKKIDPDFIVYNAGTDILDGDPLGRLKVRPTDGKQAICGLHVCCYGIAT